MAGGSFRKCRIEPTEVIAPERISNVWSWMLRKEGESSALPGDGGHEKYERHF
jgi:hypothetical protein